MTGKKLYRQIAAGFMLCGVFLVTAGYTDPFTAPTVIMDRTLHFASFDGGDIVVSSGSYYVNLSAETELLLQPEQGAPIILRGEPITHAELITQPQAHLIGGPDNGQYIVLLLPNGQGWQASGTDTEVRSRGNLATSLSQAQLQAAIGIAALAPKAPQPPAANQSRPRVQDLICANENPNAYQSNFAARARLYQEASLKSYFARKDDSGGKQARDTRWKSDDNAIWKIGDYNDPNVEELNWTGNILNLTTARLRLGVWPWKDEQGRWWLNEKKERDWTPQRVKDWWDDLLNPKYPYHHTNVPIDPACEAGTKRCPRNDLEKMDDAADFGANDRVRLLYLLPPTPTEDIPAEVRVWLEDSFLKFKYWIDEKPAAPCESKTLDNLLPRLMGKGCDEEMTFWSENHSLLFATVELLVGQYFENHPQRSTAKFLDGKTGAEHRDKAARRALRWLNDRLKFGFNEWNSPGYYEYEIVPLLNLIDFVREDNEILKSVRSRAIMMFDLLVFDLARLTQSGSFGVTAGRAYQEHKTAGWEQSVGDSIQILFGTRCRPTRPDSDKVVPEFLRYGKPWVSNNSSSAHALASSIYIPPMALLSVGHDQKRVRVQGEAPFRFVDRSRVSYDFHEAADYGVDFDNFEDGIVWWTKSAYFTKHTIRTSDAMVKAYGNLHGLAAPFKWLGVAQTGLTFIPLPQLQALNLVLGATLEEKADRLSFLTEGMALTRANLYTYRNQDALLSSVQNYRKGQMGPQLNAWQATFDPDVAVFSTYPASHPPIASHDGPHYWTGTAVNPRIVQYEDAAIIAYAPHPAGAQAALFHHRTHLWFPAEATDLTDRIFPPREGKKKTFPLDGGMVDIEDSYFSLAGPGHFDQVCPSPPWLANRMGCQPLDYKGWTFGRKGNGYVGVFSAQPCKWTDDLANPWRGKEIMCEGLRNVFIAQVGNQARFGSFENFVRTVSNARINISKGVRAPMMDLVGLSDVEASYDIPDPNGQPHRLELHYDQDSSRLDGKPYCDDEFPRYENPYTKVAWGQREYTIQHGPFKLCHNQDTGERSESCP
jgi:hypothetical protein